MQNLSLDSQRRSVRERRAAGESVAALAKATYLPRHLIRAWTSDIEVPSERERRRVARATAWLRSLIMSYCEAAAFTLEQTGPVSYVATFSYCRHFLAARLANALGGGAVLEDDTITINGIEVELKCVTTPNWVLD